MKGGYYNLKIITQYQREMLEKHGYLKGSTKVYIASKSKKGKGKTYYTLDKLADISKTLK